MPIQNGDFDPAKGPSDPFQETHEETRKKAIADDAKRQIMNRDFRVAVKEERLKRASIAGRPHPFPKPFWCP